MSAGLMEFVMFGKVEPRREPAGSSWSSPIWHGKWRIYVADSFAPFAYAFTHDDYDGAPDANDRRHGYGDTVNECKQAIAEIEEEFA